MDEIEIKYNSKWSINTQSDDELNKLAHDIFDGKVYTDRHCLNIDEISSRFIPLNSLKSSKSPKTLSEKRDELLYEIMEKDIDDKYFDDFIGNIGLIYSYINQASPISFNKGPVFYECKFLTKEDTSKLFSFIKNFSEIK